MTCLERVLLTEFFVEGTPVPQSRPRTVNKGGKVWTFSNNSPRLKHWKEQIRWTAREHYQDEMVDVPIELLATFIMPTPKKNPECGAPHGKRPDLDNMVKCLKDCLSGIVWTDDSRVSQLTTSKRYRRDGEVPGVRVRVLKLEV